MSKRSVVFAATILFMLALATMATAAGDPFTSTWRLDFSKTHYLKPVEVTFTFMMEKISVSKQIGQPSLET
jgi:hypothetical protein